ncbi:MAG: hypothetical protein GKC09_05920 [Methanosarcinales archaeon]|uniref:Uncharacterized protein n=2 Tax=root TaxID=1 RepID=A0A7K4AFI3_METSH|nr:MULTISPECIES: hypothetical protein [unclassified Methanothrix]MDY0411248.1 hypothetical protein [Methanothrix soehngenii]NLJ21750.1 hypothetical protein [Methanothrix soehngenii]NYT09462.1 hypothetical protein [Methanosarcinales archaeon]HQN31125.1 hypothetical protein [Methanothrix soehngenii]
MDGRIGGRPLPLAGRWLADKDKCICQALVSRSFDSNAVLQIQIDINDAVHRAHDGLFTVRPDGKEQKL